MLIRNYWNTQDREGIVGKNTVERKETVMQSVKELRAALLANKAGWTINPQLKDGTELPRYQTGELMDKLVPSSAVKPLDFKALLAEPSANPFIMERRTERGILAKANALKVILSSTMLESTPAPDSIPVSVDWRDRWGWPWITTIRNQTSFPACWCFAAVALVEAMVRIEHNVWPWISEGDVHKGFGARANDSGQKTAALEWISRNGAADPDCFPWPVSDSVPYTPTSDRAGRTVRIPAYTEIGSIADQKKWLDTVGPMAASMRVFEDFSAYGGGVYRRVSNVPLGGHAILIVGYDDSPGQRCWILKNSWGVGWGERGYGRIAYGESQIDDFVKIGLKNTNPDPWTKRRMHNGGMYESGNGANHCNFELLTNAAGSKLHHWWRDNAKSALPWNSGLWFGNDAAACPTLISTTYDRNPESVHVTTGRRLHHWWRSGETWKDGGVFGPSDATGVPGFIQSSYGAPGNFEVVVRTADSKLCHWYRTGKTLWREASRFASNVAFSGASLVQSHYGPKGNFELVCVLSDGKMQHWQRENDQSNNWVATAKFGSGVSSPPCMIEGTYACPNERSVGNFELCVAVGGKVQHWWRDNSGDRSWRNSKTFGHDVKSVISLLQGSYGFNLEVIVLRTDNKLQHYWRHDGEWNEGVVIGSI